MLSKAMTERLTLSWENRKLFIASDSLFEDAIAKFGEGADVLCVAYTNYGGCTYDKAVIEYHKKFLPDRAVWESAIYEGQNAICEAPPGLACDDLFLELDGLDDFFTELELRTISEEAALVCDEYGRADLRAEAEEWLFDNGCVDTNYVRYDEDELLEHLGLR